MKVKIISSKKFCAIGLVVIVSIAFLLYTGNVLAGDMASVPVTIRFWAPTRAKVPVNSLSRVLSDDYREEHGGTTVKKPERESGPSSVAPVTIYPVSEDRDHYSVGAGGGRDRVRKEASEESSFEGMVDIFYDDSI